MDSPIETVDLPLCVFDPQCCSDVCRAPQETTAVPGVQRMMTCLRCGCWTCGVLSVIYVCVRENKDLQSSNTVKTLVTVSVIIYVYLCHSGLLSGGCTTSSPRVGWQRAWLQLTGCIILALAAFGWENIQRLIQKWCSSFWADLWRALFTAVTSVWFPFGSIAAYHKLHIDNGDMVLMFVWSLIWSSFVETGSCVVTANVRLTFYSGDVLNKKHDVEV